MIAVTAGTVITWIIYAAVALLVGACFGSTAIRHKMPAGQVVAHWGFGVLLGAVLCWAYSFVH